MVTPRVKDRERMADVIEFRQPTAVVDRLECSEEAYYVLEALLDRLLAHGPPS
jgi:hypothetical protein